MTAVHMPDRRSSPRPKLARSFAAALGQPRESVTRPFSLRLSDAERNRLAAEAGPMPLGTYIRGRLLDGAPRRRSSAPQRQNTEALSQILARFGKLQLTNTLRELAAGARLGTVAMAPEIEAEIYGLCLEVREIRRLLLRALGLLDGGSP